MTKAKSIKKPAAKKAVVKKPREHTHHGEECCSPLEKMKEGFHVHVDNPGPEEDPSRQGEAEAGTPKNRSAKLIQAVAVTFMVFAFLFLALSYGIASMKAKSESYIAASEEARAAYEAEVLKEEGIMLPVDFGDLGLRMMNAGIIDAEKFEQLYAGRGGLSPQMRDLFYGEENKNVVMTRDNADIILNYLWALGLANKNKILTEGPMTDGQYGGDAGNFASTGGWTLAKGDAMKYYSKHNLIKLTSEEQKLVESIAQNIYRPCCGNSTYFPDCNHGMGMLALIEIMAAQGVSEEDIYKVALQVNAYWFPDTYLTLAKYLDQKGIAWADVNAKEVLGAEFSSGGGYYDILKQVDPIKATAGGSCSV